WKPGQTIEYTRTIFVPVYPYVGEASIQVGLYSTATQKRLPLTGENAGQWTKKDATFTFKNPKKDCVFYFDVDSPGSVFKEDQQVQLSLNGQSLDRFTLKPGEEQLKRIPL